MNTFNESSFDAVVVSSVELLVEASNEECE